MSQIELYDPVMGTREYLCTSAQEHRRWMTRLHADEMPDVEAERIADEMRRTLEQEGYRVEVLY
jgi:hypothetical protein